MQVPVLSAHRVSFVRDLGMGELDAHRSRHALHEVAGSVIEGSQASALTYVSNYRTEASGQSPFA